MEVFPYSLIIYFKQPMLKSIKFRFDTIQSYEICELIKKYQNLNHYINKIKQ